jgi:hypothetical protein
MDTFMSQLVDGIAGNPAQRTQRRETQPTSQILMTKHRGQ